MARFRIATLGAIAAASLLLASCSSGSPSGSDAGGAATGADGEALTSVTVGLLAIAPSAAVVYGVEKGIFEEHGLDVTVETTQGGAAMLPAVSTGQYDFGVGNPLSVLTAASQGIDMRIASGFSFSLAPDDSPHGDANAVIVRAGDGIASWKDLEGKKVSTNAIKTQGDLTINEAVEKDGGDASKVNYIEIAFPDALAQLDSGTADAVWIPEPFLSAALAAPEKYAVLGYPNQVAVPGLPTMVSFTSGTFAEENPEVVTEWHEAVTESLAAATKDLDGYAASVEEFTKMPAETVKKITLERLSGELDPQVIGDLSALAAKWKFIENEPDLDTVIIK